jgi:hypothetical protein
MYIFFNIYEVFSLIDRAMFFAILAGGVVEKLKKILALLLEEDRISQYQYLGLSSHIKRMMGLSWLHMDQGPGHSPLLHFRCLLIYEARWRCYHKQVKRKDGYDANVLDDLVWLVRGKLPSVTHLLRAMAPWRGSMHHGDAIERRVIVQDGMQELDAQGVKLVAVLINAVLQLGQRKYPYSSLYHDQASTLWWGCLGRDDWFDELCWDNLLGYFSVAGDRQALSHFMVQLGRVSGDHYCVVDGIPMVLPKGIDKDLFVGCKPYFFFLGSAARYRYFSRCYQHYLFTCYRQRWLLFQNDLSLQEGLILRDCYHRYHALLQQEILFYKEELVWLWPWLHQKSIDFFTDRIHRYQQDMHVLEQQYLANLSSIACSIQEEESFFTTGNTLHVMDGFMSIMMHGRACEVAAVRRIFKAVTMRWLDKSMMCVYASNIFSNKQALMSLLSFWQRYAKILSQTSAIAQHDFKVIDCWVCKVLDIGSGCVDTYQLFSETCIDHLVQVLERLSGVVSLDRILLANMCVDFVVSQKKQLEEIRLFWQWSRLMHGPYSWDGVIEACQQSFVIFQWTIKQVCLDVVYFCEYGLHNFSESVARYCRVISTLVQSLDAPVVVSMRTWLDMLAKNIVHHHYYHRLLYQVLPHYLTPCYSVLMQWYADNTHSQECIFQHSGLFTRKYLSGWLGEVVCLRMGRSVSNVKFDGFLSLSMPGGARGQIDLSQKCKNWWLKFTDCLKGRCYHRAKDIMLAWHDGMITCNDAVLWHYFNRAITWSCYTHVHGLLDKEVNGGSFARVMEDFFVTILSNYGGLLNFKCSYIMKRLVYIASQARNIFVQLFQGAQSFCSVGARISLLQFVLLELQFFRNDLALMSDPNAELDPQRILVVSETLSQPGRIPSYQGNKKVRDIFHASLNPGDRKEKDRLDARRGICGDIKVTIGTLGGGDD